MNTRFTVTIPLLVIGFAIVPLVFAQRQDPSEAPRVPELRSGVVPLGSLGEPLGGYLRIEGVRAEGMKAGISTLRVDTVDGRRLREPVPIWVENVALPGAARLVLKGYEDCRMIGQPPAVEQAAREAGKAVGEPQAGWQMQMFFVATSVVSPDGLRLKQVDGKRSP